MLSCDLAWLSPLCPSSGTGLPPLFSTGPCSLRSSRPHSMSSRCYPISSLLSVFRVVLVFPASFYLRVSCPSWRAYPGVVNRTKRTKNQSNPIVRLEFDWFGNRTPGGGGGTPRKFGWGCAAYFPKPLPYFLPKPAKFPTLFMTWPLNQKPSSDQTVNINVKGFCWFSFR